MLVGMIVLATASNALAQGLFSSQFADQRIWRPYAGASYRGGDHYNMGAGTLFLPLVQTENQLLFLDMRGKGFDNSASEGNWGLAYRQMQPSGWIIGGYGFYDLRDSAADNTWHQGVFGAELMNLNWDFRMNGYVAEGGAQGTGSPTAFLSGGTIVVAHSLERAYSGFDGEIGRLIWAKGGYRDIELRGFVGGFHFDADAAGFPHVSGPRVRLELRLFDLEMFGPDSRLTLGYQYQHDAVRGSQNTALVTLRIPFGRGGGRSGRRLTPLERRMVDPIVRDVDVVTQNTRFVETGQMNGVDIASASQIDGGDLEGAVAAGGPNSVVIATGNFTPAGTVTLNRNQAILGGGGALQVTTASGRTATFTAPGTRPTISGVVNDANDQPDAVIRLAENSTLSGVNIDRGEVGAYANGIDGFTVVNNNITGMKWDIVGGAPTAGHAIHLHGSVSGTVTDNVLHKNQGDGLHLTGNTITGGRIADNTITSDGIDGLHGIYLEHFAGGTISGNVVRGYNLNMAGIDEDAYVSIGRMTGGTISNNVIEDNVITSDGSLAALRIGQMSGGTVTNNTVSGNTVTTSGGDVAAMYVETMTGGTISYNTVNGNTVDTAGGDVAALYVHTMTGGTVSDNTVNGNTVAGDMVGAFAANNMTGGTVSNNTVDGNTVNATTAAAGFGILNTFSGGEISNNTVSNNTTTTGVAPNGFSINAFTGTARLNNNVATDNAGKGYDVFVATPNATAAGNTGSGNAGGSNTYTYP